MDEELLRIGELAARAGVSTRTVDFYTGRGLLSPSGRSGGNFRLYHDSDVQRIAAIRQLEAQGIRLDAIAHVLSAASKDPHDTCVETSGGPCPADPIALGQYLTSLDEQVRALRDAAGGVDHETRSVLATLAARAQALIATALVLSGDIIQASDIVPML